MASSNVSPESQSAARLASGVRNARRRKLTADATVRRVVLTGGGWRLHGSVVQVYWGVRNAIDSDGTLATGETAPDTSELAAPAAGSPGAGLAFPAAGTPTGLAAPVALDDYREIAVKGSQFAVLYVCAPAGATTLDLEGPFECSP